MVRGTAGGWCVVKNDFTHQYAIALPNTGYTRCREYRVVDMGASAGRGRR